MFEIKSDLTNIVTNNFPCEEMLKKFVNDKSSPALSQI